MPRFQDILSTLPAIDGIDRLELQDLAGHTVAVIENRPGKQGSLAVYHRVFLDHGVLDAAAAQQALTLFAEHVQDARAHPGRHPNIDRLFDIIARDLRYSVNLIPLPH